MKITYFTMKFQFIISIIMLLNYSCCNRQDDYNSLLQKCLYDEISENNPGVIVNVTSPTKNICWNGAAGFSEEKTEKKLLPNQTFRIASVTKTFVAATILRLWEDERLNLDDPITKYISDMHINILKTGGYDVDNIFIKHLLTHSSGLAEHTNSYKFKIEFMKKRHEWTRTEQLNDLILYAKPIGAIGEQFSYSDTGYILLGEIIEKITGESMGDAILEQLQLKKNGIKDTYMEDFNGDYTGKRIHQYLENADTYNFHPSLDYYGGGGLLSTTSDLSLFYQSLFQHKIFHNKATLDTMLTHVKYKKKQGLDYRMGIWQIEVNGMKGYTHSGFWGTQVAYFPKIKTTISTNYSQHWKEKDIAPIIPKILQTIVKNNTTNKI
ncbi:class A beta-lactamase-related serine hydrolase [Ancylomarina euxinus]|uniref:Class A beta-lactamase-related serine hydrolase n=1 Tax=Ancylomarina euxinus TaxID=2283627 RepID=A0A425Y3Z2_9BACT|nr:serine hydrolase domain-containing protein [Ancylomarina euxinus]MCZ4694606.1 serine hydrolase [Ancylomarina euxinus]MUP14149.1 serine hydrolase [Ancylomarina euxinus]RRG23005.1 class A beta-lactamase-related serine hydrolase [Ancylomarina euxinus]